MQTTIIRHTLPSSSHSIHFTFCGRSLGPPTEVVRHLPPSSGHQTHHYFHRLPPARRRSVRTGSLAAEQDKVHHGRREVEGYVFLLLSLGVSLQDGDGVLVSVAGARHAAAEHHPVAAVGRGDMSVGSDGKIDFIGVGGNGDVPVGNDGEIDSMDLGGEGDMPVGNDGKTDSIGTGDEDILGDER